MKWVYVYRINGAIVIDKDNQVDVYREVGPVEFLGIVLNGKYISDRKITKARIRLNRSIDRDLGL